MKRGRLCDTTQNNYYTIWKIFGNFYQCLDAKLVLWEDRILLFVGHLIDTGHKSQTVKSYVSVIKSTLWDDSITVNEDRVLPASLTRACKLKNDIVQRRLPIQKVLLNVIVSAAYRFFNNKGQPYLAVLYTALLSTTYYGLLRIGEVTTRSHPIKVCNVHVGQNKKKILLIL